MLISLYRRVRMTETLHQKQWRFMRQLVELVDFADHHGYELTGGELWRTPEQMAINAAKGSGILHSLHGDRLAIDLNAFKGGKFLQTVLDYEPLGKFWESLAVDSAWGGRFTKPDADHFSIAYDGRK